jgi:predicted flavoprotein YhiN
MGLGQVGQTGQTVQSPVAKEPKTEQETALDFLVVDSVKAHTLMKGSVTWVVVHKMVFGRSGVSGQTVHSMASSMSKTGQDFVMALHVEVNPAKVNLWSIKPVNRLTVLVSWPPKT